MNKLTRQQITVLIQTKQDHIDSLYREIDDLQKQWYLTSDEKQWFEEKMETVTVNKGRKKVKEEWLIGSIYWNEDFRDEDTGDIITITRRKVVRVNGRWE